jgi:hypothetical protein
MHFHTETIEAMIYTIRKQRVMIDSDLAKLYGVDTGALNRQVKRNLGRFPEDFMFQLSVEEDVFLRCQIGISKRAQGGRRYQPLVFTESGIAMLSSVLKSERAIKINISIMRTFIKLKSFLAMESSLIEEVGKMKDETNQIFKIVFERLDSLEERITPKLPATRKKIGL